MQSCACAARTQHRAIESHRAQSSFGTLWWQTDLGFGTPSCQRPLRSDREPWARQGGVATIDSYSLATVHLEIRSKLGVLSEATGFFWDFEGQRYLVTNWHCLSGRDVFTRAPLAGWAEPTSVKVSWPEPGAFLFVHSIEIELRDANGLPRWFVHPHLGSAVDIAAVAVPDQIAREVPAIFDLPREQLMIRVGMDVFVLGYPYGLRSTNLPIWKRGSLASEPQALTQDQPYRLIDTASRPGMSGAPVIRRSWGYHEMESGDFLGGESALTMMIGIYSGRVASKDVLDAQLGIVWPLELVIETVFMGQPDDGA